MKYSHPFLPKISTNSEPEIGPTKSLHFLTEAMFYSVTSHPLTQPLTSNLSEA